MAVIIGLVFLGVFAVVALVIIAIGRPGFSTGKAGS
jgi:hypothetical protein